MPKATITCDVCGQDNDPTATSCSECGSSIATSASYTSAKLEERKQPDDKSLQSETSTSQPMHRSMDPLMMMRGMKPMFLMMPIMMFIMLAAVLIYVLFFSESELPFRN